MVFYFFHFCGEKYKTGILELFGGVGFFEPDGGGTIWAEPGAAREVSPRGVHAGRGASEPLEAENCEHCELSVNVLDFSAFFSKKQAGFVQYFSAFSN